MEIGVRAMQEQLPRRRERQTRCLAGNAKMLREDRSPNAQVAKKTLLFPDSSVGRATDC